MPTAALISSFAVAFAVVAWLSRARFARVFADVPNERSLHDRPVPRVGGLAILAGVASALPWAGLDDSALAWGLAGAAALAAVSVFDDAIGLDPGVRLIAHLLIATVWCLRAGIALPATPALVLLIVWSANLYNFMDGADGLAGGMTLAGFGAYAVAAAMAGQPVLSVVCGSVALSAAAFLCFNYPPAKVFMGDAGSVPLGFLAAVVGLLGIRAGSWSWVFPLIVFLPFAMDATLTLTRRIMSGHRPWQAHRDHLYQRAVRSGLGHLAVARVEHAVMLACACLALATRERSNMEQLAVLAALVLAGFWAARKIDALYRMRCESPC